MNHSLNACTVVRKCGILFRTPGIEVCKPHIIGSKLRILVCKTGTVMYKPVFLVCNARDAVILAVTFLNLIFKILKRRRQF